MEDGYSRSLEGTPIILSIWRSLRPKHWTKNFFIFAGLLFSKNIFNLQLVTKTVFAFFVFCFLSGSVYIINDIADVEQDRQHPSKSRRPIASGSLKISYAITASLIFIFVSLGTAYFLNRLFFFVALAYLLLQLGYSFLLKHVVILDVFAIAAGFVLRVVAGAEVINVEISSWLLISTILLALFLALSKRRHELVVLEDGAYNHRRVLEHYSPYLLDQMIAVVTASTVVVYVLYTMSEETIRKFGTKNLVFTVPFVLYGIFRYLYLIHQKEGGGSPEDMLVADKPLLLDVFLWVLAVGIILFWR